MVNEQATIADIGWLAGFLDGEGSFGAYPTRRKDGTNNWGVRIQVANTHFGSIDRVQKICRTFGCNPRIWNKPARKANHKDAKYLTLNRLNHLSKILPVLIPHLTVKSEDADYMLRFVTSRLEKNPSGNRGGHGKDNVYDETELCLLNSLRKRDDGVTQQVESPQRPSSPLGET